MHRDGALLLTHQDAPEPEYQLPGGGIEKEESPLHALHREVWEETGWAIGATRRLDTYRRFIYMPEYDLWAEKICMIYLARPLRRLGPPAEPGHEAVWMDPDSAASVLASSGDRHFVEALLPKLR